MQYPIIDPVAIQVGPLQIRWYGLMYVVAFFLAYAVVLTSPQRRRSGLTKDEVGDFLATIMIGVVLGARIGYCLFYNFPYYVRNPVKIIAVWEGGMSFHGGLLGVLAAGWIYTIRHRKEFLVMGDLGAQAAPLGLFFGRIGNFINGELYGRVTTVPWAMVFPDGGDLPRHPSQIYEAFFEGLVLFAVLRYFSIKPRPPGFLLATFLLGYGVFRFILEFFRAPDPQLGFVVEHLTMGQILSGAMVLGALWLYRHAFKQAGPRCGRP